ncbi:AraC family transcriptional regulator [Halostreptopolyspora alba]|uniref:Helix-turn-helix domain-containing protein n=1 Tax=Halostreptopolyspora alba TaxID=2487137 RepID=A0A3N0EFU9_9ACTN|nr:helix-turn-helix domain-containing protein [Nocardiopsaceae bacterium YIM 96095]
MSTSTGESLDVVSTRVEEFQEQASSAFVPLRIAPLGCPGTSGGRVVHTGGETTRSGSGFRARFRGLRVNDLVVTRIRCTPTLVSRNDAVVDSGTPRLLKVALHQRGRGHIAQGGKECTVSAGELVAYETGRPYQMRFPEAYDTVVLGIPWAALGAHAELLSGRTAQPVRASEGVRPLVTTLLTELADLEAGLNDAPAPSTLHLADALVSLVVSTFTDTASAEGGEEVTDRILAYCRANLSDPGLSLASVARAHGVSVSFVQKRLRARGITLGAWIRRQRLSRIRRDLQDPALEQRSSAAIAARWGITDATHLGRALKAEYGVTPSEIRGAARPA